MEKDEMWVSRHFRNIEGIARHRGWFFLLGVILAILGMAMISSAYTATLFSVLVFGCMLIGASVVHIVQSVLARQWSGIGLSLLLAVLYFVTGALCIGNPATAAVNMTFLFAIFCFIGGLFKIIASLVMRFERWGWVFLNGLVTFILGVLIYAEWPLSGLWVIGTFVGVDMLLCGWAWMMLALTAGKD